VKARHDQRDEKPTAWIGQAVDRKEFKMHGTFGMGGGNYLWVLGIVVVVGVLWLVFKSFERRA
jgi:hypothetical protein